MNTDLIALFSGLPETIVKEIGKHFVKKAFSDNEDQFKKAVERAAKKLDAKYNFELFGGNLKNKLLQPTVVEKLKKFLLPFDPPTEADFEEDEIYFPTLPGFFADLQEALLNELINDKSFGDRMISVFSATAIGNLTTDLKSLGQDVKEIKIVLNLIMEAIQALQSQKQQPALPDPAMPPKISYPFDNTLIHIPKVLYPLENSPKDHNYVVAPLREILAQQKRVLMLGAAAMGKSFEMTHLASEINTAADSTYVVKVQLNRFTGGPIDDLITHHMPRWREVPTERLILMFDGLDEIHINFFNEAIRKLISFAELEKYADTTILISCRDNFFVPDFEDKPFVVFKLKELDYQNSLNFIKTRLGTKVDKFLSEITAKSLQGLFTSPFFLNYLVDLFANGKGLPESKVDLFEKIITSRFERDKKRFATKNIDIHKNDRLIRKEMGRLALVMESLGRNVITETEFQDIVPDYDGVRKLLEHSFLFDRAQDGWQFEHNNFQEYLAAKEISKLPFGKIIRLITIDSEHTIVKPSWVNTISFLFQLVPREGELFKQLLTWFIDNDRELLLRFERDRVDLATREEIAIRILEYYQGRGLVTRSEKFDLRDLAAFVSDSEKILDYIASKIADSPTTLVLSESCSILHRLQRVQNKRSVIKPQLERHANDVTRPAEFRYQAVFGLAVLNWQDEKFLAVLMPTLDLKHEQYDRAGLYKYLSQSGFQNKYVKTVLDLVQYEEQIGVLVNTRPSRSDFHLGDESINRDEFFNSVDDPDQVKLILEFCAECEESSKNDSFVRGIIDPMFEKATTLFLKGHKNILTTVIHISRSFAEQPGKQYDSYFNDFVDATGTRREAYQALYNNGDTDERSMNALAVIIDKPFIDFLIQEFRAGRFVEKDILGLRGALNWRGPSDLHDYYYNQINKASGDAFLYPKYPNWKANNDLRNERDLALLMDKSAFFSAMKKIYDGKDELTEQEISELNRNAFQRIEKPASNICIRVLLNEPIKPVPYTKIEWRFSKDEDWKWFQIHTLLDIDRQVKTELKKAQIDLIETWVQETFRKMNFENSFNNKTYEPTLVHLAYFVRRFDLPLSKGQYLKLLWISSSYVPIRNVPIKQGEKREPLIEWIVGKIGIETVEASLKQNFETGITGSNVIRQYFELAQRHNLVSLLPIMTKELMKPTLTSNDFYYSLKAFLEIGGDAQVAESLMENDTRLDENDKLHLIDKLIEIKHPGISALLLRRLETTDNEEIKLSSAERLIRIGTMEGLQYYKDWISRHNTIPRGLNRETIKLLNFEPAMELLFEILDNLLSPGFDRDHLLNEDQMLLDAINVIGASSKQRYDAVKLKYNEFYEKYQNKSLHYWLERLDKEYYSAKAKNATVPDVIKEVDELI